MEIKLKIVFVLNPSNLVTGNSNGVLVQAMNWKSLLERDGNEVEILSIHHNIDWSVIDVVHIFGSGIWLNDFIDAIYPRNQNIFLSPIIDSNTSKSKYKLYSFIGNQKLKCYSHPFVLRKINSRIRAILTRSKYEASFFTKSLGYVDNKVKHVPIGLPIRANNTIQAFKKKDFCLHVSSIYQSRKNVVRLIEACKNIKVPLLLAGSKGTKEQFKKIKSAIANNRNIKVLDFVSDEQLKKLYAEAKIFALPSTMEGVGQVALEAASFGCEIVITNLGGPKEYFNNLAKLVNPYSLNSIEYGLREALKSDTQIEIQNHVLSEYNDDKILKHLTNAYKSI